MNNETRQSQAVVEVSPPLRFEIGNLYIFLMVLASLATCAVCNTNEASVERACIEAGNSPEECDL